MIRSFQKIRKLGTRRDRVNESLLAIDILNFARDEGYRWRDLARKTNMPIQQLARYSEGKVLPTKKNKEKIFDGIWKLLNLGRRIGNYVTLKENEISVDPSLLYDPLVHYYFLAYFGKFFQGKIVNSIVGIESRGGMLARDLGFNWSRPFFILRKLEYQEKRRDKENEILPNEELEIPLYLQRKEADCLAKKWVSLVDDSIRTGTTMSSAINYLESVKIGGITGIYVIVRTKRGNERIREFYSGPIHSLYEINF